MTPTETVRAFWEGVWNDADRGAFDRLVAPDVIIRNEFAGEDLTRLDLIELHQGLRRMWSSVGITFDMLTCEEDRVSAILVLRGKCTDGKPLCVEGVTIMRVADGLIVEDITRFDTYAVLIRLGRIDASTALLSLT